MGGKGSTQTTAATSSKESKRLSSKQQRQITNFSLVTSKQELNIRNCVLSAACSMVSAVAMADIGRRRLKRALVRET